MTDKKYNILKAASWYTIGNILINGVSFFVLPIFTRLMSTHEYGVYSVYTSYLSIITTVVLLGLSSTITIAKFAKEVDFESYMSTVVAIPIMIVMVGAVVLNLFISVLGNILSMDAVLWNCLLVSAAATAVCGIISARLVIEGRYMIYMSYSAIHVVANVGISLLLCYTVYRDRNVHLARVFGSTISIIISCIYLFIVSKTRFAFRKINISYALKWGIPLLFHTLATVVLTQSDRILIKYMDSYSAAGIYAVATTMVSIPLILQQSFCQAWTPWLYRKLEAKDYKQIRWLNNRYIIFYGVIIAGFMLLVPDIIHLFIAEEYWGSIYSLVPLAISVFAELLYSIPTSVEYYNKNTNFIMTGTLITVVINILLDVLFICMFGYHGAAYATVLSKVILFLIHYWFSKKLDKNSMFSKMVTVICLGVLATLDVVIVITVEIFYIRYIVLATMLIPAGVYILKCKDALLAQFKEK